MLHRWAVLVVACVSSAWALQPMGQTCLNTADCPVGNSCVAGDASERLQTCVEDQVCGGNLPGNCPGFVEEGSLVCTWVEQRPSECTFGRCQAYNESVGIFKCLSVAKCDALTSGGLCSSACVSNGRTCNGRGSCRSVGPSSFTCECDAGWTGAKCTQKRGVVDVTTTTGAPPTTVAVTTIEPHRSDDSLNSTNATHGGRKPKPTAATLDDGGSLPLPVVVLSCVTGAILFGLIIFAIYARRLKKRAAEKQQPVAVMQSQDSTATTPRENIQVL